MLGLSGVARGGTVTITPLRLSLYVREMGLTYEAPDYELVMAVITYNDGSQLMTSDMEEIDLAEENMAKMSERMSR